MMVYASGALWVADLVERKGWLGRFLGGGWWWLMVVWWRNWLGGFFIPCMDGRYVSYCMYVTYVLLVWWQWLREERFSSCFYFFPFFTTPTYNTPWKQLPYLRRQVVGKGTKRPFCNSVGENGINYIGFDWLLDRLGEGTMEGGWVEKEEVGRGEGRG